MIISSLTLSVLLHYTVFNLHEEAKLTNSSTNELTYSINRFFFLGSA